VCKERKRGRKGERIYEWPGLISPSHKIKRRETNKCGGQKKKKISRGGRKGRKTITLQRPTLTTAQSQ